jgi:cob(I)alamin adenosyltransferase
MKTKFYTKNGDKGKTYMGGKTIAKDHPLFNVLGACDQLNSWLGIVKTSFPQKRKGNPIKLIATIQNMLFICMAEIAQAYFKRPKAKIIKITVSHTAFLEKAIMTIDRSLPSLKHFIVPGGTLAAAQLDYARTLARNLERAAITFSRKHALSAELIKFLNRLSSFFFALARYENHLAKQKEQAPSY